MCELLFQRAACVLSVSVYVFLTTCQSGAATHRSVLRSQVILQTRLGLVGFPAVGAVEQQLLQLGLLLPTLPHVVHVSHDAAERCTAALTGKAKDSSASSPSITPATASLPLWSTLTFRVSSGFCADCL